MKQVVITEQVSDSITLLDSALLLGSFPHSSLNAFGILKGQGAARQLPHQTLQSSKSTAPAAKPYKSESLS